MFKGKISSDTLRTIYSVYLSGVQDDYPHSWDLPHNFLKSAFMEQAVLRSPPVLPLLCVGIFQLLQDLHFSISTD